MASIATLRVWATVLGLTRLNDAALEVAKRSVAQQIKVLHG